MTERDIIQHIDDARDFPQLPGMTADIIRLTNELGAPVSEIADRLKAEPALWRRILTVINLPFYRFTEHVAQVEQALSLVGYRKICSMAAGLSLIEMFPPDSEGEFDRRQFWETALCTAVAAGEIASKAKDELPEEPFTTGLVQDIGALFLAEHFPLTYGKAVGIARGKNCHLVIGERDMLGIDHGIVSSVLCKHWSLPDRLSTIVAHHHFIESDDAIPDDVSDGIVVANVANLFAEVHLDPLNDDRKQHLYENAVERLNIGETRVDEILQRIPDHVRKLAEALDITLSAPDTEAPVEAPVSLYENCPECGAAGGSRFCSACGTSLEIRHTLPELDSRKVLIAEDSAATRLALSILIRRMGFEPIEAYNGVEAIRLAKEELPGVVLMDIQMPGMGGVEALRSIREGSTTSHIPVVMLTSVTRAETVVECLQHGASDYIVKPFSALTIEDRVTKHLGSPPR